LPSLSGQSGRGPAEDSDPEADPEPDTALALLLPLAVEVDPVTDDRLELEAVAQVVLYCPSAQRTMGTEPRDVTPSVAATELSTEF